jgi:hypothetical protein
MLSGLTVRKEVGVGHHAPGIIHEVQVGAVEHLVRTFGLFGFDE